MIETSHHRVTPESAATAPREHVVSFDCFGSRCTIYAEPQQRAAAERCREFLLDCHRVLSRFLRDSELSRLNAATATETRAGALLCDALAAALGAARLTDGLVDPTLLGAIEASGYRDSRAGLAGAPLTELLAGGPTRRPARPSASAAWRSIEVDRRRGKISRPVGVGIDLGGTAKGWAADRCAAIMAGRGSYGIDCAGDLRIGSLPGAPPREIRITGGTPDSPPLATLAVDNGAVATSGIGRRSWIEAGRGGHHLIDPADGRPCFSGLIQATALAPTAVEAEARAKAALLSGPDGAARWLAHGGLAIDERGEITDYPAPATTTRRPRSRSRRPPVVADVRVRERAA